MKILKKILSVIVFALIAISSPAQFYIGGSGALSLGTEVSTARVYKESNTIFSLSPELGYSFNEFLSAGVTSGFKYYEKNESLTYMVSPYLRCDFLNSPHFSLYVDAAYKYSKMHKIQSDHNLDYSFWTIGLVPGVRLRINDKCGLTAGFAFLGYNSMLKSCEANLLFIDGQGVAFYYFL